ISVLINGSPSKEFIPSRGLRQGDPLAHLLFNIVGEGITGMMREAVQKNLYRSFLVGKKKEPINILQYADDTIFVGGGVNWALEAAHTLNCRQMDYPFHYLGIPIGANPSSQLVWEPLINKFKSKLSKWAQKDISMDGKITLINFVLNALPIY
ncbi:Putative mitochondrial protein, partial [Glycine soja]